MGIAEVDDLSARQVYDVLELRNAVAAASGTSPLSDHVVAAVKGQAAGRHFLQTAAADLVGYAYLETAADPVAELLVGDGGDVARILDAVTRSAGSSLRVWTRGDNAPLNGVLPGLGFTLVRTLLQLRCPLGTQPIAEAVWPDGVVVRTFEVDSDEATWLALNNAAFAGHPEQASWTLEDIRARENEPWFDPAGFFLAEVGGRVVGFHWTKVHEKAGGDLGEVYVIGVDPSMQGRGLGEALLLHGLHHLREDRGLSTALLYVEADNRGAIALYERHGFTTWDSDRMFARAG
ncbi:MAG TPA: mycothiol synthase [Mycobacteriales bacterium]|nr:mycothiol synthase [Mycobacteriales bacterium]